MNKSEGKTAHKSALQAWWHTDCAHCRRWRLIVLWGLIMLGVFYVVGL